MMQADAIPDWAIYIFAVPFFPLGFVVHHILGIVQSILLFGTMGFTIGIRIRKKKTLLVPLFVVYLALLYVPNIAVVVWGILTE